MRELGNTAFVKIWEFYHEFQPKHLDKNDKVIHHARDEIMFIKLINCSKHELDKFTKSLSLVQSRLF